MHLRPLDKPKTYHNFSDTQDICECKHGIEDTYDLFQRILFTPQIVTPAGHVIRILNNLANEPALYLYRHFSLDLRDNKGILLSTIQYRKIFIFLSPLPFPHLFRLCYILI